MNRFLVSTGATLLITLLCTPSSQASPWTMAQGAFSLQTGARAQLATNEYYPDGSKGPYPLNGNQMEGGVDLRLRAGLADHVEVELGAELKSLHYSADLLCVDTTVQATSPDSYACPTSGEAVTYDSLVIKDFDADVTGLGDFDIQLKYQILPGPVVTTFAAYLKVPGPYSPPAGSDVNPSDDVALGDGQVDVGGIAYLGGYIPVMRTFVRADLGYLHRFGAPGDQVLYRARAGFRLTPRLVLAAGVDGRRTVTEGEVIGTLGIRIEDDGTIILEPVNSERNYTNADLAGIIVLDEKTELITSVFRTIAGRYVADSAGAGVSIIRRFK